MKKILVFIMVCCISILAGCGSDANNENQNNPEGDIPFQITMAKKMATDGNYDGAMKSIEALYTQKLTDYEKKQVDDIKAIIEMAHKTTSTQNNADEWPDGMSKIVKCKENVSLRANPSTSANVIEQVPLGAYVKVNSGVPNGFYHVTYEGKSGYILREYVALPPGEAAPPETAGEEGLTASVISKHGYKIEFKPAGYNSLEVYFFKPTGMEAYVIEFHADYFVVTDCWAHANRSEIGVTQYYENNSGTNAVKNSAISKGWLSL